MKYTHEKIKKYFLLALKSNRLVAFSKEDKLQGRFIRVDSIDWSEEPQLGWIKGLEFPIQLSRQVFKNKDGSVGNLYLVTNDLDLSKTAIETIYKKRWKVEVFHKSIKSKTSLAKSPAKTLRTQSNHIFMSLFATARLEMLSVSRKLSAFTLKQKLYIKAIRGAYDELQRIKPA